MRLNASHATRLRPTLALHRGEGGSRETFLSASHVIRWYCSLFLSVTSFIICASFHGGTYSPPVLPRSASRTDATPVAISLRETVLEPSMDSKWMRDCRALAKPDSLLKRKRFMRAPACPASFPPSRLVTCSVASDIGCKFCNGNEGAGGAKGELRCLERLGCTQPRWTPGNTWSVELMLCQPAFARSTV